MRRRTLLPSLLALLTALSLPACAQGPSRDPLPAAVTAALRRAQVPASDFAAVVAPLDGAEARLRHQSGMQVNPASVMKLVTTYAAIDLLGPDYTWRTRFYTDGVIDGGALRGNLYIRGGGDPKFVLERIQDVFYTLHDMGAQAILGDLVLDNSAFDVPVVDPGAFDGEALRPYNAGPDALLVNFKSVILKFVPDPANGVAQVLSEPPMAGLQIDATVPLTTGSCGDWRSTLRARFDDPARISFEGRYPTRCGEGQWPVAYQDPSSYAARALEGLWRTTGGLLTGRVRAGMVPPGATLLFDAPSLPLGEVITDVNQWSNNVMAQQVFLTLGELTPQATALPGTAPLPLPPTNFDRARRVVLAWWQRTFGPRVPAPVLDNGSGLSRDERITPEALALLLRHAAHHARADAFVNSLGIAGVNGTARRYADPRSAAYGNAWIKTGSLRDVTGVAGYVNAANGTRYVVVAFVNHPNASAARPALEALLEWTARLED
ncbi:D-alanyl-D-alanine carboxypeptidase/D-alanyl-D-alanine-endopeptidase [Hydrogenophaga sp.]|uniref:D-alanyl-D-alanine carboxypeptidase/D-alanyl-D-alanine endopeptidase n=1 Tax=Hydrogenophaga sp. TaxID=1904254 RepID=UPI0025BF06D3|nr:D-alanyl-D-alanine carboxypeptidase/D-alanyl-D-alanine-endopeptidase [Hydrogenophaga sp.]